MDREPYSSEPHREDQVQEVFGDANPPDSPDQGPPDDLSMFLLDAVRNRDEDVVRCLVDDGANINVMNAERETTLHLAVQNDDKSMVQFLLGRGADPEAIAANGNKPLYNAAESGYFAIVELLLSFKASVEAFNVEEQRTAFYQAIENGHFDVAKLLLLNGADIDACSPTGLTPLFCAIRRGDVDVVEYLLEHGANKRIKLDDGQTVEDFAKDNAAITMLLRSEQVLQGPSITKTTSTNPEHRFSHIPSLPADQFNKQYACHGFEATIVDFFLGDREQRIQVTESIYEVLYGKGAEAIMYSAKGSKMGNQQPQFRWYHLPANNVRSSHNPMSVCELMMV